MSRTEFMEMHASCVTALGTYFAEAERTTQMLAECTAEPLSFSERFKKILAKEKEVPFFNFCFFSPHFCNDLNGVAKPSQQALCNHPRLFAPRQ
jgi:hypothetical protein